jgi:hypothetical protein
MPTFTKVPKKTEKKPENCALHWINRAGTHPGEHLCVLLEGHTPSHACRCRARKKLDTFDKTLTAQTSAPAPEVLSKINSRLSIIDQTLDRHHNHISDLEDQEGYEHQQISALFSQCSNLTERVGTLEETHEEDNAQLRLFARRLSALEKKPKKGKKTQKTQ